MQLIDKDKLVIKGKLRYTIETIEEQPVIEAIPIEWLITKGMMFVDNDTRAKIYKLIKEFEEEEVTNE